MSFLGSGLGHAAFGGVALGLLIGAEPLLIALPFTIMISLAISFLKENTKLAADTLIGVLFAISVALGIIFLSLKDDYSIDAFTYLFGSILFVSPVDLYVSGIVLLIVLAGSIKLWPRWAYSTFDSELAKSDKLKVKRDDYLLSAFISVTIVVSIKLVGIVMVAAFLVIPAAASRLISATFIRMTILSVIVGIFSSLAGLIISYEMDLPSGATIIITQALLFFCAIMIKKAKQN